MSQEKPDRRSTSFVQELDTLVRARYPVVYLVTWEEQRVEAALTDLASKHGKALHTWSVTKGLRRTGPRAAPVEGTRDPNELFAAVAKFTDPSIVVLYDFHPYLADPIIVRGLRELAHALKSTYTTLVLVSPTLTIPVELEKDVSVIDVPLPTFHELAQLLSDIVGLVRRNGRATVQLTRQEAEALVKASQGLTLGEAENAFAKAIAVDDALTANDIALVLEEKRQVIRKNGLLEYYPTDESLASVGGLEELKGWLGAREAAFGEAARKFGLPEPRGLLMLGVQGCGKSLTAKAIAAQWKLPLLRLDVGRIFSGLVGSSEENLRRAIRVAESVAPAVLWVDEIEKGLSGASGSGNLDGGVTTRVFGTLLTWLQEKTAPVFVVATANRIESLPPELLRKGRFDEIFFIDLPTPGEREEIFKIHLRKRDRPSEAFDVAKLAELARDFSGAEIEQAVIAGLFHAFNAGGELAQEHLELAVGETVPLATTMAEDMAKLREWARHRTRPANLKATPETPGVSRRFA